MRDKEKLKKDGEVEKRWRRKSTEGGKTRRKTERDEKGRKKRQRLFASLVGEVSLV